MADKKYIIMCSVSGRMPTYENKGLPTTYWGLAEMYDTRREASMLLRRLCRSKFPMHRQTDWNNYHVVEYRKGLEYAVERLNEEISGIRQHLDQQSAEQHEKEHGRLKVH